jgi:acetyl-CoA carboxylase beta subunit
MKIFISEEQLKVISESIQNGKVKCDGCGWEWNISDGGDDVYVCHKCGHDNEPEGDVNERSRSFANTRKMRLFPKSAMKSNPDRFKKYDKEVKGIDEETSIVDKRIKSIEDLNKGAKWVKCKNCRKKFTQSTHKGKEGLKICPTCGTHN